MFTVSAEPQTPFLPYTTAVLADGREVLIRPMHPGDAEAERAFIIGLSPQARRYRFQEQFSAPNDALVAQMVDIDHANDEAFAALASIDGSERIVGVSRYAVGSVPEECEIAVAVLDAWQGQGLGTALMRTLIEAARQRGIRRMVSLDFAENREMAHLAHHLGFTTAPDPDDRTQVVHRLTL